MNDYNITDESFDEMILEARYERIRQESEDIVIALEAGVYTGKRKTDGKALVKKILSLFRALADKFRQISAKIFKKYEQDIANYEDRKDTMNFKSININADTRYLENSNLVRQFDNFILVNAISRMVQNSERYCSVPENSVKLDELVENTPDLKRFITNDSTSIGESVKVYLRYGDVSGREAVTNIKNIEEICNGTMLPYLKDYQTKIVDPIIKESDQLMTLIARKLDALSKNVKETPVKESYFEIEDCFVCESTLAMIPVYEKATMEVKEDEKVKEEAKKEEGNKPKPEQKESDPKQDAIKREIQYLEVLASMLKAITSSFMTVAEERFYNYIKVIRYVSSKASTKKKEKENVKKKDKKKIRL